MSLAFKSASELASMIRDREISAQALLEYFLERVDRLNPALNAVVTTYRDAARQRAKEADAAIAKGESWGPLHGVPMTIKETFEITGMATTAGATGLRDHVSSETATAVQRLLDAGAIVYGKTNVPLYAGDLQSYNEIYGTTNNPWDLERTPGGSSGGAAAALAAGLTPLELGSDIGGSIRTPAHFCGIFGLKTSYGIIPSRGHIPGPPGSLSRPDLGVMGPMARNTDDLELAFDILAGPEEIEAVGWQLELPPARHEQASEFRIAAWLDDPACPVDTEIVSTLQAVVERLRQAGADIDLNARPKDINLTSSYEVFYSLLNAALSVGMPPKVFDRMLQTAETAEPDDQHYFTRFSRGVTQRHADWLRLNEQRQRMRQSWREFFENYDIMLCPVVQTLAFPHDHDPAITDRTLTVNGKKQPYMDIMVWISLAGASYLPAAVVPVGLSKSSLPIGIQIIAPYLEDRTALKFARRLEELTGGFKIPPGYEN